MSNLMLILIGFGQLAAVFFALILAVVILVMTIMSIFCNLTAAELSGYDYFSRERLKRDRTNDTISYETHFFGPDVETHTKAYKYVTEIICKATYRYVVNGQELFRTEENRVKNTSVEPPETLEIYYLKWKPQKSFTKDTYLGCVIWEIGLFIFIWLANYTTKGFQVVSGWGYVTIAVVFAIPLAILVRILRRKADH